MTRFPQSIILFLLTFSAVAQEESVSTELDKFIERTRELIEVEVSALDENSWAGNYYLGDGLGMNISLSLAPVSGFVYRHTGCLGVYGRNYGSVKVENNRIHLDKVLNRDEAGMDSLPMELLIIEWEGRKYLLAKAELTEFANAINAGQEPRATRYGRFLLKRGDHEKRAHGFPYLPEPHNRYLLKKPIKAKITQVSESSVKNLFDDYTYKEILVTLNVGEKDGVFQGMEFYSYRPKKVFSIAKVESVSKDSCKATITEYGEAGPEPKVGWKYSTRLRERK